MVLASVSISKKVFWYVAIVDTYQMWLWFEKSNIIIYHKKISIREKLTNGPLVTLTPGPSIIHYVSVLWAPTIYISHHIDYHHGQLMGTVTLNWTQWSADGDSHTQLDTMVSWWGSYTQLDTMINWWWTVTLNRMQWSDSGKWEQLH